MRGALAVRAVRPGRAGRTSRTLGPGSAGGAVRPVRAILAGRARRTGLSVFAIADEEVLGRAVFAERLDVPAVADHGDSDTSGGAVLSGRLFYDDNLVVVAEGRRVVPARVVRFALVSSPGSGRRGGG